MPTKMKFADLEYLNDPDTPDSQSAAILEAPYKLKIVTAKIPEPDDDELAMKSPG
jgi:hypothetical protein